MEKARDKPEFTFLSMSDCRRSLHRQIYHINMMCGISKYYLVLILLGTGTSSVFFFFYAFHL